MEISPAENKVGGSGEVTDERNEDVDICRICQSPEEPDNPLKHPCACRGSLKFVHTDCLFLWINRRKRKHCEICKRSYSFVSVYSENAPERLPCHEFLLGLLMRALHFVNLILPWILVIPFNAYCVSLLPSDKETDIKNQRVLGLYRNYPGLFYTAEIVSEFTLLVVMRVLLEELVRIHPELLRRMIFIENGLRLRHRDVTGIVLLFANYFSILCDWWHDQLLHLSFFHLFERGPLALAFLPRNRQLHEFGAIRRFFFFLNDNTFAVLAMNFYWVFIDLLLPFSIGRVVLVLLRCFTLGWIGENVSEVTVGNMIILSLCFAYLGSVFTLPRSTTPARVKWFSVSVRDIFILCFKIGVLPWILGCWLDLCTFPLTGRTVSNRLEILSVYPLIATKHWYVGIWYLLLALSCMELIQKMFKKRAFWYLIDVSEANYKITKLHLGPILFAFAFHGAMVVILLHLPIKTITLISPSFFPLQFGGYTDEFVISLLGAYICVIIFAPWWLANFIKPSIKPIVHKWVATVSCWLKLSDFLLGVPRANQNVRPLFRAFGIAEGSMVSLYGSQSDTEDTNEQRDRRLMVRIGVMLVLGALSMFLVSTTFMALPILVGRTFFHSISFFMQSFGLKHDDLSAFWYGFCILRGIYIITCFVYDNIQTGKAHLLLSYLLTFLQNVLLFSIWITVIPGLLGLLIDLMIIIPSQVPLDESPIYFLPQEWLVGVIVLHIWIFLTMVTRINCFATVAWRGKLERIRNVGINGLPFKWLIRDVIGSTVNTLLITLCVPYVVVNSLFPILGFSGAANLTVQRFIWPAILAFIVIWFSAKLTRDFIIYLHQVEFDRRYKVGERVINFTQQLPKPMRCLE